MRVFPTVRCERLLSLQTVEGPYAMLKAKSKSNSSSLNGSTHPELAVPSSPLQHVPVREGDHVPADTSSAEWWKIRLFEGMANDIRRRAPFYWSDWKDAWDYRVVPATVYMYFAKQVSPTPSLPKDAVSHRNESSFFFVLRSSTQTSLSSSHLFSLCRIVSSNASL